MVQYNRCTFYHVIRDVITICFLYLWSNALLSHTSRIFYKTLYLIHILLCSCYTGVHGSEGSIILDSKLSSEEALELETLCQSIGEDQLQRIHSTDIPFVTEVPQTKFLVIRAPGKNNDTAKSRNITTLNIDFNDLRNKSVNQQYRCDKCGRMFKTQTYFQKHIYLFHICQICGLEFKNNIELNRHKKKHFGVGSDNDLPDDKLFKCDKCNRKFSKESTLKIHYSIHEGDKDLLFKCEVCGVGFDHKGGLTNHKKIHLTSSPLTHGKRKISHLDKYM